MMCELELAVCKTIRRCLWAAASMAQERGSHEIVVEDVFKAVNRFAGLSHLRCSKEDHDQSALCFQLRFPVVARYSKQILPKGMDVHLMSHKFMAIRLGFLVATLVTEVMVTKERTGVGLNWSTAVQDDAEETWAEDAEETRLRRIFEGDDEEVWDDLRDEAAKLLDVRYYP
jgi:hypothetical protein